MPHAARDHYKEGQPPNTDVKSSPENLVSEDLQTGQDNRLTKKLPRAVNEEGQSQTPPSSSKAPKMSPNLEPIAWDADVASLLAPRRPSFISSLNKTCGHATTRYKYPMEEWVSAESIYTDHDGRSHEMHGSKTRSRDFITRHETKILRTFTCWSTYPHSHKYYWKTFQSIPLVL